MRKILTVSLNPALDSAADVDVIKPDLKLRCVNTSLEPGGGGVNVSRAIKLLEGESRAFVALGGATGNMMAELLAQEEIDVMRFDGPEMTRQSFAILETSTGLQYRFGQPGPMWQPKDADAALEKITACLEPDMLVVVSGSLPPGIEADFYVRAGQHIKRAGAFMIADTSGAAKNALVAKGQGLIHVLRMDHNESEVLAGRPLPTRAEAVDFAQSLSRQGLGDLVIMARGADGSVFATAESRFHCVAPKVDVISKVGAGDSFVGGLTLGLARGLGFEEAGKLATAAASVAVMLPGSQLCPKPLVDRQLAGTVLTPL